MQENDKQYPEALTIAGSDSGGGAGISADIKTMQACKTFSTYVIVGVTAQNTLNVQAQYPLPKKIIDQQFASVLADFDIRSAKTGALFNAEHVKIVADNIRKYKIQNLVVDPVMVAKGGTRLLTNDGVEMMIKGLIPQAELVTPNLPEAEILAGQKINDEADMQQAAKTIQGFGCPNVIIKGGHGTNAIVTDFVQLKNKKSYLLKSRRINTKRTHGTGDTLSAAISAYLAQGIDMDTAIKRAHGYLAKIIKHPLYIGHGHGPLNQGEWSNSKYEV